MSTNSNRHGYIWWFAVIVGLVYTCVLALGCAIGGNMGGATQPYYFTLLVLPVLIAFVSIVLAWKWELELISGLVLIVVGLFLMIMATVIEQYIIEPLALLPLPVLGTLFILSLFSSWGK